MATIQIETLRNRKPKHVIFLGAGASKTSGYPVGDELRKTWLADVSGLRNMVATRLSRVGAATSTNSLALFNKWVQPLEDSLRLFREGGFGTIDEFCYLMRDTRKEEVKELKKVLRFVFGLHDPEATFHESDYYPFIQKLFKPSDLSILRDDIIVMSFNYDVYLEWLLRRAIARRQIKTSGPVASTAKMMSLASSGFHGGKGGLKWLREDDGFVLLKLHGLVAWPDDGATSNRRYKPDYYLNDMFKDKITERINILTSDEHRSGDVPIVFPWELIESDGSFVREEDFRIDDAIYEVPMQFGGQGEHVRRGGRQSVDPHLYEIFTRIWHRAREEVMAAKKISFVGLSMHEYLNKGFEFLFKDKASGFDFVMTDVGAPPPEFTRNSAPFPVHGPCRKALHLLRTLCPNANITQNNFAIRHDFAEFINRDLN